MDTETGARFGFITIRSIVPSRLYKFWRTRNLRFKLQKLKSYLFIHIQR